MRDTNIKPHRETRENGTGVHLSLELIPLDQAVPVLVFGLR